MSIKRVLIMSVGAALLLSASTAMASGDQVGTFQTLGNVALEETTLAPMTGEQLNAVEGKRIRILTPRYFGRYHSNYNRNSSTVGQSNSCFFCGNGNGGVNGGNANLGVVQSNGNFTQQSIGSGFPIANGIAQ